MNIALLVARLVLATVFGAAGKPLTLAGLRSAGRPVLLIFTDPDCGNCRSLLPDVAAWQAGHPERFTAALISRRPAVASGGEAAQYRLHPRGGAARPGGGGRLCLCRDPVGGGGLRGWPDRQPRGCRAGRGPRAGHGPADPGPRGHPA